MHVICMLTAQTRVQRTEVLASHTPSKISPSFQPSLLSVDGFDVNRNVCHIYFSYPTPRSKPSLETLYGGL